MKAEEIMLGALVENRAFDIVSRVKMLSVIEERWHSVPVYEVHRTPPSTYKTVSDVYDAFCLT